MRMTLAAVADDRDLLALDEIEVGILIVINAHVIVFPLLAFARQCSEFF